MELQICAHGRPLHFTSFSTELALALVVVSAFCPVAQALSYHLMLSLHNDPSAGTG